MCGGWTHHRRGFTRIAFLQGLVFLQSRRSEPATRSGRASRRDGDELARLAKRRSVTLVAVWHVVVNGVAACTSPVVGPDERLDPPVCGSRNRLRIEEYAEMLRARHPGAVVEVVANGCPMRGE
jgi:hypothetical protein